MLADTVFNSDNLLDLSWALSKGTDLSTLVENARSMARRDVLKQVIGGNFLSPP